MCVYICTYNKQYIMHTRHNISTASSCTIYIYTIYLYAILSKVPILYISIKNIVCMCVTYARVGGQEETRYLKWRHTTRRLLHTHTYIYIEVPIYSATHMTENTGSTHTIASGCGACVCVIIIIVMWNGMWTRAIIFQGSTLRRMYIYILSAYL